MTLPAPAFGALRHRNFRLFILGQFVSLCGSWMQTVALGWLALELSNSALQVGLVTTFGALPVLLFTLYGGVIADRVNRRRALLILQSLLLCDAVALGLLTALHLITMPMVYGLAFIGGLVSAFEIPIRQSWQVELVGKADLMNAIALNSSAFNLSRVIGPALAGTLVATAGAAVCFFLNAASFLAVLIGLLLIQPVPAFAPQALERRAGLREGIAHVFGSRWPRALVILTGVFSVFGASFIAILPVYARDVLHAGAGGYGAIMSAFGVGAAAGALSIAAVGHRFRRERTALGAGVTLGLALLLLGLLHHLALAFALAVVAGLSMALNAIMTNTLLQTEAPDHLRGQVMGFYSFIVVGLAPFGSLQAGWISEHAGTPRAVLLGGSVCLLAAGITAWRTLRKASTVNGQRSTVPALADEPRAEGRSR
ncbi:MAG TPA: MFS transporter [Gemmatimonadales bacterium]|jgi:MFS family permease|nr:MFS transporter [Gemmatimonadales bacterium]